MKNNEESTLAYISLNSLCFSIDICLPKGLCFNDNDNSAFFVEPICMND